MRRITLLLSFALLLLLQANTSAQIQIGAVKDVVDVAAGWDLFREERVTVQTQFSGET